MAETSIETSQSAFEAALSTLRTLEEGLQPVIESMPGYDEIEFVDVYRNRVERVILGLLAVGETSDEQRDAFEQLFSQRPSGDALDELTDRDEYGEATYALADFIDWIAKFEETLAGSAAGPSQLDGISYQLIDVLEMIGESVFLEEVDEQSERTRRLGEVLETCREVLESRDVRRR